MDSKPQPDAPGASGAGAPASSEKPRRVIKRYSNRKLYDTKDSRYVTLLQIAEMVRTSEEVQIIDNNTKEDLTEVTLAQIIYEEQKQKASSRSVPLQTLKELIHQRTEKVLSDLREGPIGRLIPGSGKSEPPKAADGRGRVGPGPAVPLRDQLPGPGRAGVLVRAAPGFPAVRHTGRPARRRAPTRARPSRPHG